MSAHAEPTIKSSSKEPYGVSYSRIESHELSDAELKSIRMTASCDVTASATNVTTSPGRPTMARSQHTVCFSTLLTTEADYSFVLDIGGQQTVVSEHIVIPNRQRTCVTKELYKQVTFPNAGNYAYSATSTGTTYLAGSKQAHSDAYIFVK
jgi:hypothetical protein